jgi:hypothetical protein
MSTRLNKAKELPPPPPPGQLTDPDFEEVSTVGMPANGSLFLIRRGAKVSFENLSPEQLEQLKAAGLAAPMELTGMVKSIVESLLPNLISKGADPMSQPETPDEQPAEQPAAEVPAAVAPVANAEAADAAADAAGAEAETAKELEDADMDKVRELIKEVAGSMLDERLSALEERVAASEGAAKDAQAETADMKKSLDALQADVETQKQEVTKALGDFRPGSQLGDHTTPPSPEEVAKQEGRNFWGELATAKPMNR